MNYVHASGQLITQNITGEHPQHEDIFLSAAPLAGLPLAGCYLHGAAKQMSGGEAAKRKGSSENQRKDHQVQLLRRFHSRG